MEAFAQILSIAGLACVVGSYQQKKKSALIAVQATGGALFAIHYLLLGAYSGFLMNSLAVLRGIVFYKEHRSPTTGKVWVGIISILSLVAYALSFLVFKTPATPGNLFLEILPAIGMIVLLVIRLVTVKENGITIPNVVMTALMALMLILAIAI